MKRAVFAWGGWEGHEPERCARYIADLVEAQGLAVDVVDTLGVIDGWSPGGAPDVFVPCWTMGQLSPDRTRVLAEAVSSGMGLAGWHGGMGDAFRDNTEYQFMVGGQFVAHPGNIIDYRVTITDQAHPITSGLADFAVRSEQYYMHVDPSNHVLAQTVVGGEHAPWAEGCRMPVAWTRSYGNGRVFYCSVGHVEADLRNPPVQAMTVRGIVWAAG